ncbi:hypothetical protein [Robertmurraya andreesenii]|uniref:Uncharacterized protein n=1 Tax=Anoxybacillus andreesenii TaxID=1325932 RepID=A0ABT9V1P4_9BACL|nr:hypothetical protein [Robertmurraya andreesenii]MDQ0154831.1 hypothetical protein [Robertmurraya andreesenii]
MSRIQFVRNEEKKYHDFCYENYQFFEKMGRYSKHREALRI